MISLSFPHPRMYELGHKHCELVVIFHFRMHKFDLPLQTHIRMNELNIVWAHSLLWNKLLIMLFISLLSLNMQFHMLEYNQQVQPTLEWASSDLHNHLIGWSYLGHLIFLSE